MRKTAATFALALAALFNSGCPALMIPGLAYSGYKYEKDKKNPPAQDQTKKSTGASEKKTSSSPPDNSIE
jgi:hypothetical protein